MSKECEIADIEIKITELQTQYYKQHPKTIIFNKSHQKLDCASTITQNIQIDKLFAKTVYILPNTNQIHFDYLLFKTYGHPAIYEAIVNYIINLVTNCIKQHNTFELHVNMQSFTMTAAQRYKDVIQLFCIRCLQRDQNDKLSSHLINMYIYNSPKMIGTLSNLFAGFIDDAIRAKIKIIEP